MIDLKTYQFENTLLPNGTLAGATQRDLSSAIWAFVKNSLKIKKMLLTLRNF